MALLRKILLTKGGGGGVKVVTPPAWCYFDAIGTVDLREQGGYYDRNPGEVRLYVGDGADGEPTGWGGWYFNRQ